MPRISGSSVAVIGLCIAANLALRFLLELGALAAVAYWGATMSSAHILRVALAIAAPATVALIWGIFISPKARIPTGLYGRAILGFVVFSVAALALHARGHTQLAAAYWGLALVSSVLLLAWPQ